MRFAFAGGVTGEVYASVRGFYIPLRRDEDEARHAVAQLGKAVEQVIDETGISEDELAGLFNTRRPFPE